MDREIPICIRIEVGNLRTRLENDHFRKQSSTFNEIFDMKISNYLPAIENFRYNVDKCAVRFKRSIMQIRISEEFSLTECKQQEVSVELYYQ
ncbi:hypothetical protein RIR_jg29475.t1 [Rhizophagus irregularis DAOM 181602=DAOM 197198]|nr:hypothetical protein RIR_jg29475.t1 [Rhizophagus irregularis DAOM 181602=DAOM 197198]